MTCFSLMILLTVYESVGGNYTNFTKSTAIKEEPSTIEILLPPILLLVGGTVVLSALWIYTKYSRRETFTFKRQRKPGIFASSESFTKIAWADVLSLGRSLSFKSKESRCPSAVGKANDFLAVSDLEILSVCRTFQNQPLDLLRVSIPATISLIICPITLLMHRSLVAYLWPKFVSTSPPNINESIACFLAPAGMVYAVSFGFAFQQVLSKQIDITRKIMEEVGQIDQLISLTRKLDSIPLTTKLKIYKAIKTEIIYMIQQLTTRSKITCLNNSAEIWNIVDLLREMPPGSLHTIDAAISHRIVKYISCLNNASDKIASTHSRMHPLQWIFLEMLGYFSFLGVLLVQAESYRMELAMCIITVTSISMLCYIVSDLDAPFHGFFRIDLSIFETVIQRLETLYNSEFDSKSSDFILEEKTVMKTTVHEISQ